MSPAASDPGSKPTACAATPRYSGTHQPAAITNYLAYFRTHDKAFAAFLRRYSRLAES
jgi:hypothetical protein